MNPNPSAQAARQRRISVLRWAAWWIAFAVGVLLFYILLTPIWIGLRGLAWFAEFRARRRKS